MVKKAATYKNNVNEIEDFKIGKYGANTPIVFTLKSFIITISTILGIFIGFYQLVVVPKIDSTESHYKEMYKDQKSQNKTFYEELGKINTSIGSLSATLNAIKDEKSIQKSNNNSGGGSLGNYNTKSKTAFVFKP